MPRSAVGPLIASVVLITVAGVVLVLSGDSGEPQQALAPTPTAEPEATVTPAATLPPSPTTTIGSAPLPTLAPTDGTLVYLRGTDLWVASLDGGQTLPPRAITTDSLGIGYAGHVSRADGGTDLYFTIQLSEDRVENNRYITDYGLYRATLKGGEPEELFRFSGRRLSFNFPSGASVSPNGEHVAYSDTEGLVLLDLASGERTRLLSNGDCTGFQTCVGYYVPKWSPTGGLLKVTEVFYEGAFDIIINPFESPVSVIDIQQGGLYSVWSPDGERLCMGQDLVIGSGMLVLFDVGTGRIDDLAVKLQALAPNGTMLRTLAHGCVWSEDGRLTVSYIVSDDPRSRRIAVIDEQLAFLTQSESIPHLLHVLAWLPDSSGVVFDRSSTTGAPRQPRPAGIYHLKQGILALPFEADQVLGVIR